MRVIDFHTHTYPDKIAEDTVKKMAEIANVKHHSIGTTADLINCMDSAGVDLSVTLPVATKKTQVESINRFALKNQNDRIVAFGGMHPDYENVYEELKYIRDKGLKGIKLHPDYQEFYPIDRRLYPVYEACEELGLIIVFHSGDDIGVKTPGHALPRLFDKMLKDFPNLKAVFAHMGGWEMWDQALKFLVGKEVYFDTSMVFGYIEMEKFYEIVNKHGDDKILFGTDIPWASMEEYIEIISKSSLSDASKEKIFSTNAEKLLGL